MAAFIGWGVIAYLVAAHVHHARCAAASSSRARPRLILLIGLTRIYLDVHFVSDVAARFPRRRRVAVRLHLRIPFRALETPRRMNLRRRHIDIDGSFWFWAISGAFGACLAGSLYAVYLQRTGEWSTGLQWEVDLMRWLHVSWPAPIDWILLGVPMARHELHDPPAIAFTAWHLRKRGRGDLITALIVAGIGNFVVGFFLKFAFDRPRPDLWPPRGEFTGSSYPSGHTMMATSLLFVAAYLLRRERGWTWPYVVCMAFTLVTSYSRLYLGVHWPTDVIGGAIIGAVWLSAMLRAMDAHADELFEIERRSQTRTV